tara:strand:+ start:14418 stop:14870 length:453 start_codon:yes stop_codon:yes gene_type:complete
MKKTISFVTIFGWITASEEEGNIIEIKFSKKKNIGKSKVLKQLKKEIKFFFSKSKKKIKLPLKIQGSKLQKKIWNELKKIPYGKTKSYGEISKKLKTSPRYVGNVCGQNRHLLVIPCHRVIRSNGKLGGFSGTGGIDTKKKLLKFEGAIK